MILFVGEPSAPRCGAMITILVDSLIKPFEQRAPLLRKAHREGAMRRRVSIGLYLGIFMIAVGPVSAEEIADCQNRYFAQRKEAKEEYERERSTCDRRDVQCNMQMDAKLRALQQRAGDENQACQKRVISKMPPPPAIHWKPGDPSPVAPNGQRYIMSCSGKVVGVYKPGGAMEVELQSRPGNCIPSDNPWPGPGVGGTAAKEHCYEQGTGSYKEYSGGRPSWCDPNR
jgi:hypothetical protein